MKIQQVKIEEEINSIVEKFLKANETMQVYLNGKIEELQKEKNKIIQQIINLDSIKTEPIDTQAITEFIDNWDSQSLEDKKQIARLFIKQITYTDEELNIEFLI